MKIKTKSLVLSILFLIFIQLESYSKEIKQKIDSSVCRSIQENPTKVIQYFNTNVTLVNGVCDEKRNTPLMLAIKWRKRELFKMLLALGADPNTTNQKHKTPLILALEPRQIPKLNQGRFPVTLPVDPMMVKHLIKKGAKVNYWTQGEDNPLLSAIELGNFELMELLVQSGADINLKGIAGTHIFHYVLENYDNRSAFASQLYAVLAQQYSGKALKEKISWKDVNLSQKWTYDFKTIQWMIQKGARTDVINEDGYSSLVLAGGTRNKDIYWLIYKQDQGKHLKRLDPKVLFNAIAYYPQVAIYLIQEDLFDVNKVKSQFGTTALIHAIILQEHKVVDALLYAGADPRIKDKDGENAIDYALRIQDKRIRDFYLLSLRDFTQIKEAEEKQKVKKTNTTQ